MAEYWRKFMIQKQLRIAATQSTSATRRTLRKPILPSEPILDQVFEVKNDNNNYISYRHDEIKYQVKYARTCSEAEKLLSELRQVKSFSIMIFITHDDDDDD
jgi:hypothetical protein